MTTEEPDEFGFIDGYYWKIAYIVSRPYMSGVLQASHTNHVSSSDGGPYRTVDQARAVSDAAIKQVEENGHRFVSREIDKRRALASEVDRMEELRFPANK